jgi:AbrB family looped-hinge helix DNA binding protein
MTMIVPCLDLSWHEVQDRGMTLRKTHIGPGGRVVLPAAVRERLSLEVGDEVVMNADGHAVTIMKPEDALRHARDLVRRYVPAGRRLSDELVVDRRREAKRGR